MNASRNARGKAARHQLGRSATIAGLILCATPSMAQEGTKPDADIVVTATQASTTGTKSGTPVVEVPQSLSIVGKSQIDAQAAQTVSQAIAYQAGVFNGSTPANGRYDQISLRGFNVTNTGVLVDGLRATTAQTYTKAEPYALEQIEVLRGPASVLYGQNSPGGLVNMISKRPIDTPLFEIQLQGGSFDRKQFQFDLGGPVGGDVSFRVTGVARDAGTQIDKIPDNKLFVAPALAWRAGTSTTLTLLGSYSDEKYGPPAFGIPLQGSLLPNPNGRVARDLYTDEPGVDNHRDQYAAALMLEQRLGGTWMLRSATRYTKTDFLTNTVSARGTPLNGRLLSRAFYRFRIASDVVATDNHLSGDWSLGGLGMRTMAGVDYRNTSEDYYLNSGPASPLDVFAPVYGRPYGLATTPMASTLQSSDQVGIYGEQQLRPVDHLILSAGVRHDWSDTTTRNRLRSTDAEQNTQATTWRGGVVYRGPWGLSPYASYATSFNPILGTDFFGKPWKPSRGKQIEGGLRIEPRGWRTYLTLAAYKLTQSNVQTTDPANPLNQIQTGEVRSKGVELEISYSPVAGLNLTGSATFADQVITRTTIAIQQGKRPTGQPERTAALWADYTAAGGALRGFGVGGGTRYVGGTFADAANTIVVPDYAIFDALVRYDTGKWRLSVNATNLFNHRYLVSCGTTGCGVGADRTIIAGLRYRFGGDR